MGSQPVGTEACATRIQAPQLEVIVNVTSGAYRESGILPVRRYTKRLVQTSKSDKSNNPNGKQVGESAARGEVSTERSLNIYDSHTTPRYAGYAQGAYANSGALETISKRTFKKCVLYLKENLQLYVRGAHQKHKKDTARVQ